MGNTCRAGGGHQGPGSRSRACRGGLRTEIRGWPGPTERSKRRQGARGGRGAAGGAVRGLGRGPAVTRESLHEELLRSPRWSARRRERDTHLQRPHVGLVDVREPQAQGDEKHQGPPR